MRIQKRIKQLLLFSLFIITHNIAHAQWQPNGSNIYFNTGNVGIGTTTPGSNLVVNGKARIVSNLAIGTDEDGPAFFPLQIKGQFATVGFNVSNQVADQKIWAAIATGNTFRIITENDAYSAVQEAFVISRSGINVSTVAFPNGNVGIGTADTKGYKLAVNGAAVFTRAVVKLNANWPDFVFHPDYQLPSLAEVESYIKTNQHLPGIPSAKEVEKEGLDLGEMNKQLLQKVEELTLYMIEQQKLISQLNYRIKQIENTRTASK